MKSLALIVITVYQKTISPDHGWFKYKYPHGFCRYYPSCSQYAYESIDQLGVFKGSYKSVFRVIKCNPFMRSKVDLVNKIDYNKK